MLSPLKPLLCRHDYYWSERHRAERCRRCGKLGVVEPLRPGLAEPPAFGAPTLPPLSRSSVGPCAVRRERLLALLDSLAEGAQPSREEALDTVLAVIEDAHSADPVLFGAGAAAHFARLHEARNRPAR